ncbi:ParB/RepB/Spo0J family partition protein [Carboxydothermus hydrogenoformans]|uniref:Stage 0 sporulation protein J n=1 Tax=Carboxydothermus hydrogenoformans (strain ATCC BAA-161 / DSM 6008 / Z-2901) TaxID=246194 RepID=Q3AG52_CARHZ|nr:ParB/RepB/Spo0J family partition protein [Carboxydothermus hydrogenoformans]ABB14077.1 stage 0 sporulation protein J [Carboxydothermus hydrogenoformans Z-2901]
MKNKKGLGRGLNALIPEGKINLERENGLVEINVEKIVPNPKQPRTIFSEEALKELAESIQKHGVLQPIVVRKIAEDKYELVAGERRWRAAQLAGLKQIPAVVKDFSDEEATVVALMENLQREDLNPLEQAKALKRLIEEFGLTQEEVAENLAKSRTYVTNLLRLLNLPPVIQEMVEKGELTYGHARTLLALDDPLKMSEVAREIIKEGLSVRATEELVKKIKNSPEVKVRTKRQVAPEIQEIEDKLRAFFATKVEIKSTAKGRGKITIEYYSPEELQRILDLLYIE